MKKTAIVLFNFIFAGSLFADITLVQRVKSSGVMGQPPQDLNMIISVKGSKAKIENMAPNMSQVIDLDTGKLYVMNAAQKTVMVVTVEDLNKMAGMMGKAGMTTSAKKLGTSKTVNAYSCEEYKIIMTGVVSSETVACVSPDIETGELDKFSKLSDQLSKQFGGLPADVKGFPVLSDSRVSILGKEMTSHSELISVSHDTVADDIFVIPSDYKVQEMPRVPQK